MNKNNVFSKAFCFLKNEALFTIALVLALASMAATAPSLDLIKGINWKTLILLLMLFVVLEGFKKEKILVPILSLSKRIRSPFLLSAFLTFAIFFLSSFITNDVSLLAFVPITIALFTETERERYIIDVVALETISANLGSLLTPFGNPQNLFLFDKMEISGKDFVLTMLPIYITSLILLALSLLFVFRKDLRDELVIKVENEENVEKNKGMMMFYFCLLIFTLFAVLGYANWLTVFIFFMAMILLFDRSILKRVDWMLLLTFLCFFIFSTNLSQNKSVNGYLSKIVNGHEFISSLVLSQVISNVPSAILLEPFSTNLKALLYGVDVGGLGTLVASLSSLIAFRLYSKSKDARKMHFFAVFTLWNVVFLIFLVPISCLILSK